jgi:hypothetical protein
MSTIEVHPVEPNAYKTWIKEAFTLFKRSPILFIILNLPFAVFCFQDDLIFLGAIIMSAIMAMTSVFFGLKTDYDLSIKETFKRIDLENTSFLNTFFSSYKLETFILVVGLIILVIYPFLPELPAKKIDPSEIRYSLLSPVLLALGYGFGSVFKTFNVYFNVIFGYLKYDEFSRMYDSKLFELKKPFLTLIVVKITLIFMFLTIRNIFNDLNDTVSYIMIALTFVIAFSSLIEYVAFREIFMGRGKNKEVKEKSTEINAVPSLG